MRFKPFADAEDFTDRADAGYLRIDREQRQTSAPNISGKLALVSVTTGTSADTFAPNGINGAILDVRWPVHNGLRRNTASTSSPRTLFKLPARWPVHVPACLQVVTRRW